MGSAAKLAGMKASPCRHALGSLIAISGWFLAFAPATHAIDSAAVKELFADPPREYSSGPLWVWNDLLSEQQIRDTMRDLAGQHVKQVFVHPRPGLMTPYLSADWFRLWKVALDEAAKLDMNVWIYDENSYPSGFAGGWVPELMPESRGMGLSLKEAKSAPKWSDELVAVYRLEGDQAENVTAKVKAGEALPEGRYQVASIVRAGNSPWHGNRCYANLLTAGVTQKFLEVTHEAYKREIGDQFGKRVPGSFTDEPNIRPAGGFPWCPDLPAQFEKRWGYDLLDHLPSLSQGVGDWRRVRHNYFATLNDLFIERWAKPYYEWCDRNGLEFTGHYWDHDWPDCLGVPDNMAMAAWQHRPGIDCLMNQYAENTHAQFGNVRFCREISSIANQLGRKRTFVELYGAGGWDLRFEDMKRIADWLQVLGVNTMDEHLSYVTLRGARKRDHPQSFSYHEPWWDAYHVHAQYMTRLSAALSQGEQINQVLVIEPTTTAWMYQGNEAKLREIGDSFFNLLMALEAAQIEYDLGDEDVIAREARLENAQLRVGQRLYQRVILPPGSENLHSKTWDLLQEFLKESRPNLFACEAPIRRDGGLVAGGNQNAAWKSQLLLYRPDELLGRLKEAAAGDAFHIIREPNDKGILFHQRRELGDGQIVFLVNTSIQAPSAGTIQSDLKGVEQWNLNTGRAEPYPFEAEANGVRASFNLPPSGSLLLFLSKSPLPNAPDVTKTVAIVTGIAPPQMRRIEPNLLTLDYVDVTAGGETRKGQYFYAANQFAWQKNGMPRDPWDSAVQFKDELIAKTFPADSGFEASYRFTIEGAVPQNLAIVIERPDLYSITCNGQELSWGARASRSLADASSRRSSGATIDESKAGTPSTAPETGALPGSDWWLDKAFGRIPIAALAKTGENVVTIKAQPFTMFHELESAYVLGDFTLKPAAKGFVITSDQPLALGKWNEQGQPFFSKGVAYRQQFDVAAPKGEYRVALPSWYGSVAKVIVNGTEAGYITAPPWECDVTPQLKAGQNTIEVVVIGTLKNTLGPHHGNPGLGSAWPGMFQSGPKDGPPPGKDYSTVGYGLFEPFVLKQARPASLASQQ